ncbi:spore coat protein YsxE [Bacillus weihaiensis]|uniref:spore coat protein YsxE n=1 Tax=Bacillus weihaiensis TaxID=1547283 RepID=UPI0023548684|nr:spore coat protein YsxE [Bacillus weihaiensis]
MGQGIPQLFFSLIGGFLHLTIQMEEIEPLLRQYDLTLEYGEEVNSKVMKIYTNKGPYVVKLLPNSIDQQFLHSYSSLRQSNFTQFVPIVLNRNQQLTSHYNGQNYYISPWLPNEPEDEREKRHQYLFQEMARLHKQTEQNVTLLGHEVSNHYETYVKELEENKAFYEAFVEKCEQKLYLSPFELQAVTYYIEVSRAIDFSIKKIEEWYEKMGEKETSRISLTHRKISAHHFLYDHNEKGHFINFEQARYASPIDDFLLFITRIARTTPVQSDDCVNWFYTYQKEYPYTDEEMLLFLSYLAYPHRICSLIKQSHTYPYTELEKNRKLVKAYWQFKNIEYVVMKLSEIEERKKREAEAAEAKATNE